MQIGEEELVAGVSVNMEELTPDWMAEVMEADEAGVERYIRAKLPEALRAVLFIAPAHLVSPVDAAAVWRPLREQDGSGQVLLPDDVLRMVAFKMRGWRRAVTRFPGAEGSVGDAQTLRHLRGGVERPACLVGYNDGGEKVLFYYALPPSLRVHRIEKALYVPQPRLLAGGYELARALQPAVQYFCAGLVYELMGRADMAKVMHQRALL